MSKKRMFLAIASIILCMFTGALIPQVCKAETMEPQEETA